jgi:hypothetical protein
MIKRNFLSLGAVTGLAAIGLAMSSAPARAVSLTASQLGLTNLSANAPVGDGRATTLSKLPYATQWFTPEKTMVVKFSILDLGLGSRGANLSSFGFLSQEKQGVKQNLLFSEQNAYDTGSKANTNDWLGTCGKAIVGACEVDVTFQKGKSYQLMSLGPTMTTWGVASAGQYVFDAISDQYYQPNKPAPKVTVKDDNALFIGMEDGGYSKSKTQVYYDYQDWVVKATKVKDVPEPTALAGLGIAAIGLLKRKRSV